MRDWGETVDLNARRPKVVDAGRAAAGTKENLEQWIERILRDINPDSVPNGLHYNVDETMLQYSIKNSTARLKVP